MSSNAWLALLLDGPMQSWGHASRFERFMRTVPVLTSSSLITALCDNCRSFAFMLLKPAAFWSMRASVASSAAAASETAHKSGIAKRMLPKRIIKAL